jgi:hypothetical protein
VQVALFAVLVGVAHAALENDEVTRHRIGFDRFTLLIPSVLGLLWSIRSWLA